MSDRYIEKSFLYLLALSVLLHLAVYQIVSMMPADKAKIEEKTTMVDLTDIPLPPPPPKPKPIPKPQPLPRPTVRPQLPVQSDVDRYADKRRRVPKEIAPKGENEIERIVPQAQKGPTPSAAQVRPGPVAPATPRTVQIPPEKGGTVPVPRGDGIFKRPGDATARPTLFPTANRLARLEESYRKKYGPEVEDGETAFLNTDDIRFGSFLRRLETAIYGVWQYPREALMRGEEGTTPVRITFNRRGEVVQVDLLESSGSKILDNEVLRTLHVIGPVGSFPKGYSKETFKLIAFFHYGNGGGRLH